MRILTRPWGHMHFRDSGSSGASALLFANSLGTDFRMWEAVGEWLSGVRTISFDKRGHGLSATPEGAWDVADLAKDAIALLDHLGLERVVVAGCSVGGLIAQALAVQHPERVAALFLSNTAAQIGTPESWQARIDAVQTEGLTAIAPAVLARWFAPAFLAQPEARLWATMLERCDPQGYIATCGALARADLTAQVPRISCPALCLAGSEDQATPPDLVRATADLIPGASFVVLEGSGHLPAIDAPDATARLIRDLMEQAHD